MTEVFRYSRTIYLQDITVFGNAYYASYFLWQGEGRDLLFKEVVGDPKAIYESGLKLVTLEASMRFTGELNLMDELHIEIYPSKITITTIELHFSFKKNKTESLIAEGHQRIGFIGKKGHPVALPKKLLENGRKFLSKDLLESAMKIERKISWIQANSALK